MIGLPKNAMDKFKQGIDLSAHYTEVKKNRVAVMLSFKVLAIGLVATLLGGWCGLWQRMALKMKLMLQASYPQLAPLLSPAPVRFSSQFMFFFAWIAIIVLIKHLFAGRSKAAAKSSWFYFGRMLVGCLWAGVCGLGFGITMSLALIMGKQALLAAPWKGGLIVRFAGAALMSISSAALFVYVFHAMLVGVTFGMALLLQNKGIKEAYLRGSQLMGQHWPFIVGIYLLLMPISFLTQHIVFKMLPSDGLVSVLGIGFLYAWWPMYWIIFIPYFKRVSRKRS